MYNRHNYGISKHELSILLYYKQLQPTRSYLGSEALIR